MKILTEEESREHYNATLKGGLLGGSLGLAGGLGAVALAHRRFPTFRALTLPLKAFLVTSAGTFSAIIEADRYSRQFELDRRPEERYQDRAAKTMEEARKNETGFERFMNWGRENRYSIVGGSWVLSMGIALALVGRNPYLTGAQKLVQARVYAQGLTVAVLVASAVFEIGDANKGQGRWETVRVLDPNDPEHKKMIEKKIHHESYAGEDLWRDMVEAEERKMKERKQHVKDIEEKDARKAKPKAKKQSSGNQKETEGSEKGSSKDSNEDSKKGEESKEGDSK
ncbi:MAG: hypothetical protein M4579_002558 [Chaenotheca gracillima]|nr:MAG: hypothetical protein M4579_002558 [Chaenotheca gracillima]